jgi:hypothetical protein
MKAAVYRWYGPAGRVGGEGPISPVLQGYGPTHPIPGVVNSGEWSL